MGFERLNFAALYFRFCVDAEHARNVRPVDIGIHETDAMPFEREGRGEIRRHRRLSNPALAARDREHLAQIGQLVRDRWRRRSRRGGGARGSAARRCAARAIGRIHDAHLHTRHTRHALDRFTRLARQ